MAALLLIALDPAPARAQRLPAPVDTAAAADTARISARGAFIRSLVLPGWGQSYVGAPGRGAIYFALESGSLWMTVKTWHAVRDAKQLERTLHASKALPEDERLPLAEAREEQLEDWLALSIFLLLFSGADAYVAAQLADFGEHVGVRPGTTGGVQLQARVPLGRVP